MSQLIQGREVSPPIVMEFVVSVLFQVIEYRQVLSSMNREGVCNASLGVVHYESGKISWVCFVESLELRIRIFLLNLGVSLGFRKVESVAGLKVRKRKFGIWV